MARVTSDTQRLSEIISGVWLILYLPFQNLSLFFGIMITVDLQLTLIVMIIVPVVIVVSMLLKRLLLLNQER